MGKLYNEKTAARVIKAAAYVRVSLETDRLCHSLSAQSDFYTGYIRGRPGWELAGIYADSFLSGTESVGRPEFMRLISDCENGKVDVVLCKSISRFARNTVDLLNTVRHLKELGIEIRFEKEKINSLSEDGELLMTVLASFAQEESRSISENVKWGIRKRFRSGEARVRNKTVFGYRYDGKKYVVREDEARAVRLIFDDYINGVSLRKIAENLNKNGFCTTRGFDFSPGQINYIVHNEIYLGNIIWQKTFVKDFITHSKSQNKGELPKYEIIGCHEAIISGEIFAKAEEESRRRAAKKQTYLFSGKLICSKCKKPFSRFSNYGKYATWHCRKCENAKLKEDKLKALFGMSDEEFSERVQSVEVFENGELNVKFYNGGTEIWRCE